MIPDSYMFEREPKEKRVVYTPGFSLRYSSAVQEGLEFLLSHFSEPLYPRMVSTAATRSRQFQTNEKHETLLFFQSALYEDCRISGYSINQTNPDLMFIDIDRDDFKSHRALKLALNAALKNIEKTIGGHPTVIWSGNGYHIYQPIDAPTPLENIKDLAELEPDTSNKFLQFAKRYLSLDKCDRSHNPAIRSCMLRVPGSLNSKCKGAGLTDAEVKIIQKWDRFRPHYRLLLGSFYADLVGRQKQQTTRIFQTAQNKEAYLGIPNIYPHTIRTIPWIECLLQIPITDYRKHARDLILIPYLVVSRGITDRVRIYDIVMQWASRCAELRRPEPSRHEFVNKIQTRIEEVMRDRVPPMRLETLREKNLELFLNVTNYNSSGGNYF